MCCSVLRYGHIFILNNAEVWQKPQSIFVAPLVKFHSKDPRAQLSYYYFFLICLLRWFIWCLQQKNLCLLFRYLEKAKRKFTHANICREFYTRNALWHGRGENFDFWKTLLGNACSIAAYTAIQCRLGLQFFFSVIAKRQGRMPLQQRRTTCILFPQYSDIN